MKKRQMILGILIIIAGMILTGCTDSENNTASKENMSKSCFSQDKSITGNTDLKAIITDRTTSVPSEKSTYTLDETENLGFGMTGKNGQEAYYGTYELCDLQTGEYLQSAQLSFEDSVFFDIKSNPNALTESMGQQTQFIYTSGGKDINHIPGPGTYSVNTFSAKEGGEWQLADTFQFTVTE